MGAIVSGLIYLRIMSLRNLLIARIARLKQPKYLIGGLIGVAYLYFVFGRRVRPGRTSNISGFPDVFGGDLVPVFVTFGAVLVLFFIALCWMWARDRASLSFNEAEIAFLFPAPIGRKALIHFQLIDSHVKLLVTSLIFAFLSRRWQFVPGGALIRILGWWLAFSTVSLHITGSAFTITKLLDRGVSQIRRQLAAFGVIGLFVAGSYWWIASHARSLTTQDTLSFLAMIQYVTGMLDSGPLGYLLLPAKWIVRPLLSPDLRSFLVALGPALLVFAAHYAWVLYSEASFEEGSIARAQKRAARLAAMRAGNFNVNRRAPKARRTPFDVARASRVEFAFLWKNLLSTTEYLRPRALLIAIAVIVIGGTWLANSDHDVIRRTIGAIALVMGAYVIVFGPMLARQDLRSDLLNTDILKTYPLRGWQIVLGEILTPVAVITGLLWLLLLTAAFAFQPMRARWLTPEVRIWGSIAIALLMPLLCAIQVLVLNAAAVLFPAWIDSGTTRNRGLDVMGQRILFLAGLLLTVLLALVPASIVAAAIYFLSLWAVGVSLAAALALAGALGVLCGEIALGVQFLGKQFDNFDLSAELRP